MTTPYREPVVRDEYPKEKTPMVISNWTKATASALSLAPTAVLGGVVLDHLQTGSGLYVGVIVAIIVVMVVSFIRAAAWVVTA